MYHHSRYTATCLIKGSQSVYRQIQLAIANCNEDDEGMIDYHKESVQMAKLVLMAQVQAFTLCL